MQPNKSVEEIVDEFEFNNLQGLHGEVRDKIKSFLRQALTSHTNTVLQGVVEMVGKLKQKELEYTKKPSTNTAIRRMMVRRQSRKNTLDEVSSLLNDQIISNEK